MSTEKFGKHLAEFMVQLILYTKQNPEKTIEEIGKELFNNYDQNL